MALTLKTAISADQTTIDVEGTDTLREGSYRTLGDETVLIRTARVQGLQPGETAWQRLSVDRGIENTEAVAHDAAVTMGTYSAGGGGGVTVDPGDGTPVPVTGFVAPGATIDGETATLPMTIARLGPFTVNHDDPGLGVDGIKLADLVTGTIVFAALVFIEEAWDTLQSPMDIALGGPDWGPPDADYGTLHQVASTGLSGGNGFKQSAPPMPEPFQMVYGLVTGVTGALVAYLSGSETSTQGQATVYALIAVPA